jgi:hypothetical protein
MTKKVELPKKTCNVAMYIMNTRANRKTDDQVYLLQKLAWSYFKILGVISALEHAPLHIQFKQKREKVF